MHTSDRERHVPTRALLRTGAWSIGLWLTVALAGCFGEKTGGTAPGPNGDDAAPRTAEATPAPTPALEKQGQVTLRWTSYYQNNVERFEVYRSESREGPWTRINEEDELIPGKAFFYARPGESEPEQYTYVDEGLEPGAEYWYYIGKVDLLGNRSPYTRNPIKARAAVPGRKDQARATPTPRVAPPPPSLEEVILRAQREAQGTRAQPAEPKPAGAKTAAPTPTPTSTPAPELPPTFGEEQAPPDTFGSPDSTD